MSAVTRNGFAASTGRPVLNPKRDDGRIVDGKNRLDIAFLGFPVPSVISGIIVVVCLVISFSWFCASAHTYWVAEESLPPWTTQNCTVTGVEQWIETKYPCDGDRCYAVDYYHTSLHLAWNDQKGIDTRCVRKYGETPDKDNKFRNSQTCIDYASCNCWNWLEAGDTEVCYYDTFKKEIRVRKTSLGMRTARIAFYVMMSFLLIIGTIGCVVPLITYTISNLTCCVPPWFGLVYTLHPIAAAILAGLGFGVFSAIVLWIIPFFFYIDRAANSIVTMVMLSLFCWSWLCALPFAVVWGAIQIGVWLGWSWLLDITRLFGSDLVRSSLHHTSTSTTTKPPPDIEMGNPYRQKTVNIYN